MLLWPCIPQTQLTQLSGCYIFRHYLCSITTLVDLYDDRTRGSQEICDTSGVSTIIPVFYTLKCGMSLLEVWFHLCKLFIFIRESLHHLSSYAYLWKVYITSSTLLVTGLYYLGLNMTTIQGTTMVQVSGKSV